LPEHYHHEYAPKSCPGNLFNERFIDYMSNIETSITTKLRKREVTRQRIKEHFEYHQTKSDCSRYSVIWAVSDVIGRALSVAEVDNFKRWSDMFTDLWEGSNTIVQMDIILKRWNFNHPELQLGCYASTPWMKDKMVGKFLLRWYDITYARTTWYDFVKDKGDGTVDNTMFESTGRHSTRAIFDKQTGYIIEINNYDWEKNNMFSYKDFLWFARNWNLRDYVLVVYKKK
jgi:hypothetical protein